MAIRKIVRGREYLATGFRVAEKSKIWNTLLGAVILSTWQLHAVNLQWNENPEPDIAGYRVWWGETNLPSAVLDVGKATSHSFSQLLPGKTYRFSVTAYNLANLESAPSAPVHFSVPAPNTAPTISAILDQTVVGTETLGPIPFTVTDSESEASSLVVSAHSSNPSIVPEASITFGGAGEQRTVTLKPSVTEVGTTTVTLSVWDGAMSAATSFDVTVNESTVNYDGLLLGYGFEEQGSLAFDISGNGYNAILTNGVVRGKSGEFGGVVEFNGGGSRLDVGAVDIPGSAMTISCWIKPDSFTIDDARLISKALGTAEQDHIWMLSTIYSNGGVKPRLRLKTTIGNTTTLIGTANLQPNSWTHLAATYDGAVMRLFVNGSAAGAIRKSGQIAQAPNVPASIGDQPQGGRGFDGLIDDVRIYSRALGQSEIAAIMTELLGLPSAEPADTTPPISPDNLIAKVLTSTSIELTWQASTDASGIAYYEILRDGIILSTATGTSFADSGLDPGATYHYRVRAVDSAGNTSAPSSEVVVQMPTGIPTDPALMLAFAFEEDGIYALDQTANENDGLLTGAVDRTNVRGSNGVVVFQGGKIDLGGLDIPGSAMTISCWVFAHSFGQDTRIVSKATGIYENDHVWMLSTTTSNGIKPRMRLKTGNGDTTTLIGTVNLTVGVWTHLAATYDGRVMALWVNAQPAGFVSKAGSIIQSPTVPASIGDQPQGGHSFDGLMDDFRIYTRALTQSELQELAAASQP